MPTRQLFRPFVMEALCLGSVSMRQPPCRNPTTPRSRVSLSPPPPDGGADISGEESEPHGALLMVLPYLRLPELLAFQRVCRLFRDVIADDSLLWRRIAVEPPLSGRLTNEVLLRIASKAGGKLRSLALLNCREISDDAILTVLDENPSITKLCLPGCSYITAKGVVRAVKRLSEQKGNLKHLQLHGVRNLTREHLETLSSLLCKNVQNPGSQTCFYSYQQCHMLDSDDDHPIDVDICPRCENARLVFDCTREEECRLLKNRWMKCRGCIFCIPRCVECGGCIDTTEECSEAVCLDSLCLVCWLRLPKCDTCNRPYCRRHAISYRGYSEAAGFVCELCRDSESFIGL